MELSIGLRRSIHLLKVDSVKDKIFADLMAIGYKDVDAFLIAHPEYESVSEAGVTRFCKDKQVEKKFSAYFEKQKRKFERIATASKKKEQDFNDLAEGTEELLKKYKDKDFLIQQFAILAEVEKDPKRKADILTRIAELQNMKKEENKEERKYLSIYLPQTCDFCSVRELSDKRKEEVYQLKQDNESLRIRISRLENKGED